MPPITECLRQRWTSPRCLRSTAACQAAAWVSHRRRHLVRRVVTAPTVLAPPFLGHLVRRSTGTSRTTPPPHTWPPRGDHAVSASGAHGPLPRCLLGWIGPPGRGPAGLSACHVWQAATPRTVSLGQFQPNTVPGF
jgi:hypothetical protein